MAKARDDESKGAQPPKGDEPKGSSPPPPPQPGQASQPAGQATAGGGPPGLPVSGAEPPVGDPRHSGGTSAAGAAEVPAGGIPTPGRTPPQETRQTTPGGIDRGPGPTTADAYRPRSDDPRHPRVLVAGAGDEEVTVSDVCDDLRAFVAAFRARDWPRLGHAAADFLHLGLNVLSDQHRPTTRIGREDHQALSREWAEFETCCREFDQCRGEAAAAAPGLTGTGLYVAGSGSTAGLGTPAGVGFSPADLVLWFEVASRVLDAIRGVRTASGFRPATA